MGFEEYLARMLRSAAADWFTPSSWRFVTSGGLAITPNVMGPLTLGGHGGELYVRKGTEPRVTLTYGGAGIGLSGMPQQLISGWSEEMRSILQGFMGKLMNLQCGTSVINASEPGGGLTNIFLGPWRRGRDLEVDEFRGPCLMLDVNAMAPKRGIAATAVFFGASGPAWMGLYRAWGIMWGMGMSLAGVNVSATIFASAIMAVNSSWRLSVEPESPQRESAPVTSFGRPSR
jgi:hypothetical protein